MIVPPVPTPATMTSTRPPVSSQISRPVVRSWTSGLAGLSNCCGTQLLGVAAANSWALAIAPFMPSLAGVSTRFAPSIAQQRTAFQAHRLGHGERQVIALGGGDEGQGDARVAAGRLDDLRVRVENAVLLGGLDHRPADAVLDAAEAD